MKLIADTNTFLCVALGEPERESIIVSTKSCDLVAPEILPYEIGNAISKMTRRSIVSSSQALKIHSISSQIPVSLVAVSIPQALLIASEHKIYAYDAYFLQAAIEHSCPILSLDKQLLRVAKILNITVKELS